MKLAEFRGILRERIISALDWSRKHKVRAVVYGVCMALFLEYLSLPNIRLQELRKVNPQRTALMEQREREAAEAGKPFHIQQNWVPLYRISPYLAHAVIVSEDGTFYENGDVAGAGRRGLAGQS